MNLTLLVSCTSNIPNNTFDSNKVISIDKPKITYDVKKLPNLTQPIPADEFHIHFGKGQTEVELNLSKGQHSLQLLLGDYSHIPHDKPMLSEKIHITVK